MELIDFVNQFGVAAIVSLIAGFGLYFTCRLAIGGMSLLHYGAYERWSAHLFITTAASGYLLILLVPDGWHYMQLVGTWPFATQTGFINALENGIRKDALFTFVKVRAVFAVGGFLAGVYKWRQSN